MSATLAAPKRRNTQETTSQLDLNQSGAKPADNLYQDGLAQPGFPIRTNQNANLTEKKEPNEFHRKYQTSLQVVGLLMIIIGFSGLSASCVLILIATEAWVFNVVWGINALLSILLCSRGIQAFNAGRRAAQYDKSLRQKAQEPFKSLIARDPSAHSDSMPPSDAVDDTNHENNADPDHTTNSDSEDSKSLTESLPLVKPQKPTNPDSIAPTDSNNISPARQKLVGDTREHKDSNPAVDSNNSIDSNHENNDDSKCLRPHSESSHTLDDSKNLPLVKHSQSVVTKTSCFEHMSPNKIETFTRQLVEDYCKKKGSGYNKKENLKPFIDTFCCNVLGVSQSRLPNTIRAIINATFFTPLSTSERFSQYFHVCLSIILQLITKTKSEPDKQHIIARQALLPRKGYGTKPPNSIIDIYSGCITWASRLNLVMYVEKVLRIINDAGPGEQGVILKTINLKLDMISLPLDRHGPIFIPLLFSNKLFNKKQRDIVVYCFEAIVQSPEKNSIIKKTWQSKQYKLLQFVLERRHKIYRAYNRRYSNSFVNMAENGDTRIIRILLAAISNIDNLTQRKELFEMAADMSASLLTMIIDDIYETNKDLPCRYQHDTSTANGMRRFIRGVFDLYHDIWHLERLVKLITNKLTSENATVDRGKLKTGEQLVLLMGCFHDSSISYYPVAKAVNEHLERRITKIFRPHSDHPPAMLTFLGPRPMFSLRVNLACGEAMAFMENRLIKINRIMEWWLNEEAIQHVDTPKKKYKHLILDVRSLIWHYVVYMSTFDKLLGKTYHDKLFGEHNKPYELYKNTAQILNK